MEHIKTYISKHKDRFLHELKGILQIPSVSADSAYTQDVTDMADAVKQQMQQVNMDNVEVYETEGYPIVYGEKIIDEKLPTVLVYGHYDVQPPEPLETMGYRPFHPYYKGNRITSPRSHIC